MHPGSPSSGAQPREPQADQGVGDRGVADELRLLRRQVADLQLENDILKKAAVILGTKPQPRSGR